ncbi:MAG: hypothetical protein QOE44_2959 [Solirubrobacteraceae bacterium]|nr:hypothetical protein [Solirubrobacteraceae bacterium]
MLSLVVGDGRRQSPPLTPCEHDASLEPRERAEPVSSKQEAVANGHLQVIGEGRNRCWRAFWSDADGKPLTFADAGEAWLLMVVRAVLGHARSRGWVDTDPSGTVERQELRLLGPSVAAEHNPAAGELEKVDVPGGRSCSAISKRAPSSVRPGRSKIVPSGLAIPAHNEARSWTSAQAAAATRPLGAHDCFVARLSRKAFTSGGCCGMPGWLRISLKVVVSRRF